MSTRSASPCASPPSRRAFAQRKVAQVARSMSSATRLQQCPRSVLGHRANNLSAWDQRGAFN
eukprot:7287926-Pyramimonas_sp.AAC.1